MLRLILGVVAGYVAIGVLVSFTNQIFATAVPGSSTAAQPPLYYFGLSLITNGLYTIVGGYLCAFLARDKARQATLALIGLGEVIGLTVQIALWKTVPHWYGLGLLVIFPIGVLVGSSIRMRWGHTSGETRVS